MVTAHTPVQAVGRTATKRSSHVKTSLRQTGKNPVYWFFPVCPHCLLMAWDGDDALSDRDESLEYEPPASELASVLSNRGDGLVYLSKDGKIVWLNDAFADLLEATPEGLRGRSLAEFTEGDDVERAFAAIEDGQGDGSSSVTTSLNLDADGGAVLTCEVQLYTLETEETIPEVVGIVRRDAATGGDTVAEDALAWSKSFLALAEAIPDGIIVLDAENDIQYANPAVADILGYPPQELVGGSKLDIIPPRLREAHLEALSRYLETGERHIDWSYVELPGQHRDGFEVPLGISLNDFTIHGERYFVGLFRDITPRKEAEQEAMTRVQQQETLAALGHQALQETDVDALLEEATQMLAEQLDAEFSKLCELDTQAGMLRLRAGVGWDDEVRGDYVASTDPVKSQAGFTLDTERPIVVEDFETEDRFAVPAYIREHGIHSGITVTVGPREDPWGVLGVCDTQAREFSDRDVHFVENVANVLASAIEHYEDTRQIEAQRAQLAAITQVYRVVQDIQQAVVQQTSREEIEQTVCGRLVEIDVLDFAWVGRLKLSEQKISSSAHAGLDGGFLDEIPLSAATDSTSVGLACRAIQERAVQIVSNIDVEDASSPWAETARERGYRSAAAIPITYEQTTYGVLVVYATVQNAFRTEIADVFETLGELLGHAMTAISQRWALHADSLVKAEFHIEGLFDELGIDPETVSGIELDRLIPMGDGVFHTYGRAATTVNLEEVESLDVVESLTVVTDDESHIEIHWTELPLGSLVSAAGGRIQRLSFEEEATILAVELPPTAEVKSLVDQIESAYPGIDVLLQQWITVDRDPSDGTDEDPLDSLTKRQRNSLEAAYYGGYFEWPRDKSANDLAEEMDIAGATFHQHLRSAEREIFTKLFE